MFPFSIHGATIINSLSFITTPSNFRIFGWDNRLQVITSRQKPCRRSSSIAPEGEVEAPHLSDLLDIVRFVTSNGFDSNAFLFIVHPPPNVGEPAGRDWSFGQFPDLEFWDHIRAGENTVLPTKPHEFPKASSPRA